MSEPDNQSDAALVFQLLSRHARTRLMDRLPADAIRGLLEQMKQAPDWTPHQVHRVYQQLRRSMESIRNKPLPVDPIPATVGKPNDRSIAWPRSQVDHQHPFHFLIETELSQRILLLQEEHPQHIAVILSTLPPLVASETMRALDPNLQVSVLKRLCDLDQVDIDLVNELSFEIKLRHNRLTCHSTDDGGPQQRSWGLAAATEIMRGIDDQSRESVLRQLETMSPETKQLLNDSAIRLEFLLQLTEPQLQRLLAQVDTSLWAPALRGSDLSIRSRVLRAMAPEAAKILSAEISALERLDPAREQSARSQILAAIDRLDITGRDASGKAA